MAPRFSLPSASVGINRFHCWPVDTTDSYSASDLTANWDLLDGILGAPSGGTAWPPTTGLDGGIYKLFLSLQNGASPIGTTSFWFRPSTLVPLTTITNAGWHVADGTVLNSAQHSFPGLSGQNVTLPDMRHRIVLGADPNFAIGAAAAAAGTANIDSAAGAPGPQAISDGNQIVQTIAQMPGHGHSFSGNALGAHTHAFSGALLGNHLHRTVTNPTAGNDDFVYFRNDLAGGGTNRAVADMGSYQPVSAPHLSALIGVQTSGETAGTPVGSNSSTSAGTPSGSISNAGSGSAMDNRSRWIGLIPIIKVLVVS